MCDEPVTYDYEKLERTASLLADRAYMGWDAVANPINLGTLPGSREIVRRLVHSASAETSPSGRRKHQKILDGVPVDGARNEESILEAIIFVGKVIRAAEEHVQRSDKDLLRAAQICYALSRVVGRALSH